MGFKQTAKHRFGKGSYHQIGLVRGQFGNVPMDQWVKFLQDTGFDGWEEASWELDLRHAATPTPAPRPTPRSASIWPRSTAWKSSPSPPTCKARPSATSRAPRRCNSSAARRSRPTRPGATRATSRRAPIPYFVPDEVGKLIHEQAPKDLLAMRPPGRTTWASCRTARWPCPASSARRPTAGATGSCSRRCPASIGGHAIPDVREVSLELLVERFGPVLDLCKKYGVTFDLECHPSERAMGDLESASDYLNGDGQGRLRAAWSASTSTARTWNGRACR